MRFTLAWLMLASACWSSSGCGHEREPVWLELVSFSQARAERVYLNEALDFRFSLPLDPTSLHPGSAQVVDAAGNRVAGTWSIDRRHLSFEPRLPVGADLADAGFQPGRRYTVILGGFPRIDGLRSRGGESLARTHSFEFRTVERPSVVLGEVEGEQVGALFVDEVYGPPLPLTVAKFEIGPAEPILLVSSEPLDPRTITGTDFELLPVSQPELESVEDDGARSAKGIPRIQLRARLRENLRTGATIELWPLELGPESARRILVVGDYLLSAKRNPSSAREFSGIALRPGFGSTSQDAAWINVSIQEAAALVVAGEELHLVDFLDTRTRSDRAPEDADGTALWDGSGLVSARFPAAAGTGVDGEVALGAGRPTAQRLDATRIACAPDARCELPSQGYVQLCAQASIAIDGALVRRVAQGVAAPRAGESVEDWVLRMRQLPQSERITGLSEQLAARAASTSQRDTLSQFLESARRDDLPWTVLVAGGDLTVRGDIWVDGPLLLIAGGWVRISGRVTASEVWTSTPRGGAQTLPAARELPFELDPPLSNPLRVPVRWSVTSQAFVGERSFGPAAVGLLHGDGRARVRFIGESIESSGLRHALAPVEDPSLLFDCSALVLRIDLDMPATGSTDAEDSALFGFELPRVDSVRFTAYRNTAR